MSTSASITKIHKEESGRMRLLKGKCLHMYRMRQPFKLTKQGSSYELESNFFNARAVRNLYTSQDRLFIKLVKDHIIRNDIADKFIMTDYGGKK